MRDSFSRQRSAADRVVTRKLESPPSSRSNPLPSALRRFSAWVRAFTSSALGSLFSPTISRSPKSFTPFSRSSTHQYTIPSSAPVNDFFGSSGALERADSASTSKPGHFLTLNCGGSASAPLRQRKTLRRSWIFACEAMSETDVAWPRSSKTAANPHQRRHLLEGSGPTEKAPFWSVRTTWNGSKA